MRKTNAKSKTDRGKYEQCAYQISFPHSSAWIFAHSECAFCLARAYRDFGAWAIRIFRVKFDKKKKTIKKTKRNMKFKQTNFFVCWFPLAPIFCWDIRRVFRVCSCISFSTPFAILYIITFSTFVLMAMQFKYKHRQIGWLKIWLFESMHQIGCGNAITMPNNKECQTKFIERQEKTNREFF